MKSSDTKITVEKFIYTLTLVFVLLSTLSSLQGEEYSIRKKKISKKQENPNKSSENASPIGFSRENNKISNQFWLEEGAIYTPDTLESSTTPIIVEPAQISSDTPSPSVDQKPKEDNAKGGDKPSSQKSNIVVHFLSENKKVLLILGLIAIFAIYRLRGDSPSSKNQNTRIFSKFRNK